MQKLPAFNTAKHEFTYFATIAMKNAMAVQAIESRINVMTEAINALIDRDSSVDLVAFKATFLGELATLLNQKSEFEFSNSLFDLLGAERTNLKECVKLLDSQFQTLTQEVSKIESAFGHEKVDEGERFNTCQPTLETETKHNKIVLIDGLN